MATQEAADRQIPPDPWFNLSNSPLMRSKASHMADIDLTPETSTRDKESIVPIPVALIAFYQFAKAAYILYAFHAAWVAHKIALQAGQTTSDPFASNGLGFLLPVFALIMVVAGVGLIGLQRWARHMLLAGGALALPWLPVLPYPTQSFFSHIVDYNSLRPFLPQAVMLTIMVIDVLAYAVLVFYPDVAESFGEKGGDPYFTGE